MDEADEVVWMVRGAWVSLCLRAACELGIMDSLEEPRTVVELAERTSSNTAALSRLLRVLVDLGLLESQSGRFTTTPRGAVLRVGHPCGFQNS